MVSTLRIRIGLLFLFANSMLSLAANNDKCSSPLGMEDETIRDDQITAKTWLYFKRRDTRHYRPYYARLNSKTPSGGWCSEDTGKYPGQYLEVDLMKNWKVTAIATQGRHQGSEWVEYFKLEYKRNNETQYRRYKEKGKWKTFEGNQDINSTVKHVFRRPMILRNIKIIPLGNQFTIHCMRIELYGCTWNQEKDGLLSYSAPLGEIRKGISLKDDTYDGYEPLDQSGQSGPLFGGIGKLTDGVVAAKGPAFDAKSILYTKWVGYKLNPLIFFSFNSSRKFNSISFHVLNKNKNMKLFEKVSIELSKDGVKYKHIGSYYPTGEAREKQGVLFIKVPLNGKIGQYLRCSFDLGGSWLLISEIEFNTEQVWALPSFKTEASSKVVTKSSSGDKYRMKEKDLEKGTAEYEESLENSSASKNKHEGLSFPIILTIVLVGIVIVIALFTVIIRFVRSSRKSKRREKNRARQSNDAKPIEVLEQEEKLSLQENL